MIEFVFAQTHRATEAVQWLMSQSTPFTVTPLPDDEWGIAVKAEERPDLETAMRYHGGVTGGGR